VWQRQPQVGDGFGEFASTIAKAYGLDFELFIGATHLEISVKSHGMEHQFAAVELWGALKLVALPGT